MKKKSLQLFMEDWNERRKARAAALSGRLTPAPAPPPAAPSSPIPAAAAVDEGSGRVSSARVLPAFGQSRPPRPSPLDLLPPLVTLPPPPTPAFANWSVIGLAPPNPTNPNKVRDLSVLNLLGQSTPPRTVARELRRADESEKEMTSSALANDCSGFINSLLPRPALPSPPPAEKLVIPLPAPQNREPKTKTKRIVDLKRGACRDEGEFCLKEEDDGVLHYCEVLLREKKLTGKFLRSLAAMGDGVETLIDLMMEMPLDTVKISKWAETIDFDDDYYMHIVARRACQKLPSGIVRVKDDSFAMGPAMEGYCRLLRITFSNELKLFINSRDGQASEKDLCSHLDVDFLVAMQLMKSFSTTFEVREMTGGGFYVKMKVIEY
ncbi:hypothetical protein PENTCL1PPCAC_14969 [Pristionchus entomophagus]|uniref:Uncharacterized protein n=1 Tax=Pristionchus entomophagus TaxID=358040 RepID=A0AAV5TBW8_9BILA|nr:hypothetical protein PENTCL1PPCAC_14969 [Pristionchus entomophagus]